MADSPLESYSESSRKFRRTFYTQPDWVKHRDSNRFLKNIRTTFDSGVIRQVAKEVAFVGAFAIFIFIWNNGLATGWDDFQGVHHDALFGGNGFELKLPLTPFTLSSPALALLLVFRTNSSYGRWNEARTAWGSIINNSRSIVRMGCGWLEPGVVPREEERAMQERLANAVWSFSRSLTRHLLSEEEDEEAYRKDVMERLNPVFAQDLISARHRPCRSMQEITSALRDMPLDTRKQMEVEKGVTALCNALGACERMFSSPVPLVYTRHTARFVGFWLLLLPLGLWDPFASSWNHWGMIPAVMMISFFMLGVEELSVQLEEPYSVLPMEKMTGGIGLSVAEHVDWRLEDDERMMAQELRERTQFMY
eukprot:CAMPEP_0195511510 /NCGR_PEP_ID=MMETSP0794_2-20130614/3794_1 /TAXON_ID=515487 /ORGANISM="Stephanopyxis turris, Strain CCMP 815" /LENGTH=364 /DNA_ID=CAMNT_0040639113 /DNA_START=323 /DNA_END=1417 /DNA_ORIENTATION=+